MSGRSTSSRLRTKTRFRAVSPQTNGKLAAHHGLRAADCPYSGAEGAHGKRHAWLRGFAQEKCAQAARDRRFMRKGGK